MVNYFVAIDGGGTKTDVALFDDAGRLHRRVIGENTNPNTLTIEQLGKRFDTIFRELFSKVAVPRISHCFAGMSGADHPLLNERLKIIITDALPVGCEAVQVENDAVNALWSGTEGGAGMVIIAGTGSIGYGRYENGESFRLGGWGHLVSDEGSGFFIGTEAVREALRAHDGLRGWSSLFDQILQHFQVDHIPDLIPIIYDDPKPTLAGLVPVIQEAVNHGDPVAEQIFDKAAEYLCEMIEFGLSKFNGGDVPVVLAGGLWKADGIYQRVAKRFDHAFVLPQVPPLYGSMIGALKSADQSLKKRLKSTVETGDQHQT